MVCASTSGGSRYLCAQGTANAQVGEKKLAQEEKKCQLHVKRVLYLFGHQNQEMMIGSSKG